MKKISEQSDDILNNNNNQCSPSNSHCTPSNSHEERICVIIDRFCSSLVDFTTCVIYPAINSTELIRNRKTRTNTFDNYVDNIDKFNTIINRAAVLLKGIIFALNLVFVDRTPDSLASFMNHLSAFLSFLSNENVFMNLNNLNDILNEKYSKDVNMIKKVTDMKYLIFRMCNLSIDVVTLFIPPLGVIKEAVGMLEDVIDDKIENQIKIVNENNIKLNIIIKNLYNIQINAEVIVRLNSSDKLNCLIDKNAEDLIRLTENLQNEYIELLYIMMRMRAEIDRYNTKKTSLFSRILKKLVK